MTEFLTEKEKRVLEVGLRRKIYQIVKQYAGIHFREIERKSILATGSVQYHLNYLKRQGLIKIEKEGNTVRYFPQGFKTENKKIMVFLRQKSIRDIILLGLIVGYSLCVLANTRLKFTMLRVIRKDSALFL